MKGKSIGDLRLECHKDGGIFGKGGDLSRKSRRLFVIYHRFFIGCGAVLLRGILID